MRQNPSPRPLPKTGRARRGVFLQWCLPGELDLAPDQVAIDTGDKAGRRLAAARRVAAVVEADVVLPLQVVALEVVVEAESDFLGLLIAAEGVVVEPHGGWPARRGGGDAQGGPLCGSQVDERAVA